MFNDMVSYHDWRWGADIMRVMGRSTLTIGIMRRQHEVKHTKNVWTRRPFPIFMYNPRHTFPAMPKGPVPRFKFLFFRGDPQSRNASPTHISTSTIRFQIMGKTSVEHTIQLHFQTLTGAEYNTAHGPTKLQRRATQQNVCKISSFIEHKECGDKDSFLSCMLDLIALRYFHTKVQLTCSYQQL